jgi:hypothetical protein
MPKKVQKRSEGGDNNKKYYIFIFFPSFSFFRLKNHSNSDATPRILIFIAATYWLGTK